MGQVTLSIGGSSHLLACKDGEEAHLLKLGTILDEKVKQGVASTGSGSEARQLLFGALLLADALVEGGKVDLAASPAQGAPDLVQLEVLAAQLEALAEKLEQNRKLA